MKKKIFKFLTVTAMFAVAMVINASVNTDAGSHDVNLADLVSTTEANAECVSDMNNGTCGISNICFWGRGDVYDCDTTRG